MVLEVQENNISLEKIRKLLVKYETLFEANKENKITYEGNKFSTNRLTGRLEAYKTIIEDLNKIIGK